MTATPLRDETVDTYSYFGNPIYTYSLKQGIEDGFLAPYRVHRVVTDVDAAGWHPTEAELDRFGRTIPTSEYTTKDFERIIALRARTEAMARYLSDFMAANDRFAKTVVFCVDQEHADEMRRALGNCNADLLQDNPDYVCRVTADEGEIGRGHLSRFQELETRTPVILTTSQLLTTGVDAPMIKNVVIARVVGSMAEFKQIIGRGTRVRDDYGKYYFNILDFTGSATRQFADPEFDGEPALIDQTTHRRRRRSHERRGARRGDVHRDPTKAAKAIRRAASPAAHAGPRPRRPAAAQVLRRRRLGGDHRRTWSTSTTPPAIQQRIVQYTDYTADAVRTLYPSAALLRSHWADAAARSSIIQRLADRGIDFELLAQVTGQPDADPFDLLCHVAYNAPLRTRRERAGALRQGKPDFFARYAPEAQAILDELLDKYAEHGIAQFVFPEC